MSFIALLNNFLQWIAQLRDNADCADGLPYISGLPVKVAYVKAGQSHQTAALPSHRCSWNRAREPWLNVLSARMADSTPSV